MRILAWVLLLIFVLLITGAVVITINLLRPDRQSEGSDTSASEVISESVTENGDDDIGDIISNLIENETSVSVYEPTPEDLAPTEEEIFEQAVREYISAMPLADKVAGLFIVYPEQITGVQTVVMAGDGTKNALISNPVGGIVYRSQNITSSAQFKQMLANTASFSKYPLFLAVSEELGNTVIASKLNLYKSDSQSVIGATGVAENAFAEASQIAEYLADFGINLNLGVIAELTASNGSVAMENRTFSAEADVASDMVSNVVKAYEEKNINTALGFFPGQSTATQDTSIGIASASRTDIELEYNEFKVYDAGIAAGGDAIIVSHVIMSSIAGESIQSTLSKTVMTDVIRDKRKYEDVIVITDIMSKSAISDYYESGESAVKAIKAGADMVMCPADYSEAYNAVMEAVKSNVIAERRVDDSLTRIYKVKFKGKTSDEIINLIGNAE